MCDVGRERVIGECVMVCMMSYLNDDTALDEVVKCDVASSRSVELPDQHFVKPVRQPVAEAGQSCSERKGEREGGREGEGGGGKKGERDYYTPVFRMKRERRPEGERKSEES